MHKAIKNLTLLTLVATIVLHPSLLWPMKNNEAIKMGEKKEQSKETLYAPKVIKTIKKGDLEKLKKLLAEDADVDAPYTDNEFHLKDGGMPLLHWTVKYDKIEIVKFLVLEKKASVQSRDNLVFIGARAAALHHVKSPQVAEFLVDRGADHEARDESGRTPYHWQHNLETMKFFFEEKGAKIDCLDNYGKTPLFGQQDLTVIRYLIDEKKADVNHRDKHGSTPLYYAWQPEAMKLLIAMGAKVNVKNKEGGTPLHAASHVKSMSLVEILIANSAEVNEKDNRGEGPLNRACWQITGDLEEDLAVVKFLVQNGADAGAALLGIYNESPLQMPQHIKNYLLEESKKKKNNGQLQLKNPMKSLEAKKTNNIIEGGQNFSGQVNNSTLTKQNTMPVLGFVSMGNSSESGSNT
ncbi:MAG: ankyrin repeat domain-containing protein [Candidatus Dependentiae bacterium]|nr:ankyrin repeat domain-containing protein [Candidatus Dependentiae bacterium]